MAAGTVRVRGLRELQRDFRRISKDLAKEVREGLKAAAEPVRQEAAELFNPVDAHSAAGYRVSVRQKVVTVQQSRRRTTGQHPEYGSLQMRRALIPARSRREDEVVEAVDKVLAKLAGENGF